MKIGVLSDTHDRMERTARAIEALGREGAVALVHCGDFTSPNLVGLFRGKRSFLCLGNNDEESRIRAAALAAGATWLGEGDLFELGGRRLAASHGDSLRLRKQLLALAPDFLFVGHSHRRENRREGSTRIVNPGALHRATSFTVAIVDLATDSVRFLPVSR